MHRYVVGAMVYLLAGAWARAQISSVTVSGGFSNVEIPSKAPLFYERDGGYADGEVLWPLPGETFPLLLGAAASGSTYADSQYGVESLSYLTPFVPVMQNSHVGLISFEARAAVPFSFARRSKSGFFVEPKLGAGVLIDTYAIEVIQGPQYYYQRFKAHHVGTAFDIRPGIQGGYTWGWGSVGLEASYMAAFGDFGRVGSTAQEIRLGVFIRVNF